MTSTTFSFFSYTVQPANLPPVALVTPSDQSKVIGSVIKLDGRHSYDPEGQPLTYTWSLVETPTGSELTDSSFELTEPDSSVVGLTSDIVGTYVAQLVVNDGQFDSTAADATVRVTAALSPVCTDIIPDARFIFRTISDFWSRHFQQREVLPIIWSAYIQSVATELLRLYEVNHNKSIQDIQDMAIRRWLAYDPLLDLDAAQHYIVQGNEQEGLDASSGPFSTTVRAILLTDRELRVVEGAPRPSAVGGTIEVLTSNGSPGNRGTYSVQRLSKSLAGYQLLQSTKLPDVPADRIASGADLVTTADSHVVRSPSTNFAAPAGFETGDYLSIETGVSRGFHEITGIGMADGLPDNNSLQVASSLQSNGSEDFTVYNVVEVKAPEELGPFTDLVYMPAASSDVAALNSRAITGNATIKGTREVIVGPDKTFDSAVGRTIKLLSGSNVGAYSIGEVNEAKDGYIVTGVFVGPFPAEDVPFSIDSVGAALGRIVTVGDRAYTVLRAYVDNTHPDPPVGPGEVGILVMDRQSVSTRLDALSWRIPVTLVSEEHDFELVGVDVGDVLIGTITRLDTGKFATVHGTVVGVDRHRLGFEFTRQPFADGEVGDISDAEILALSQDLEIDGVAIDVFGNITYVGTAEEIRQIITSEAFDRKYGNLPLRDLSDIDIGPFSIRISVSGVVRNRQLLLDDDVLSVPCLREYIRSPVVEDTGSSIILLTRDSEDVELDGIPVTMLENRDYIIDDESSILGRDGEFSVAASTFDAVTGDFLKRRIRPGDQLEVEYGPNSGTYVVVQTLSSSSLHVKRRDTGGDPIADELNVEYTIARRVPGRYLRFDPELWTALSRAPDRLWAETTYISNAEAVEDNFGVLVSLTEEQLSTRETRSVTYRTAVEGLMYAWANGPTVQNIRIGAQILLGLPVAVSQGTIIAIDDVYSLKPDGTPEFGRILVEDTDPATGDATGIVRIYLFPAEPTSGSDFLTGVAENPETGAEYVVGDAVTKFAPLSKGVDVLDYVEDPTWWRGIYYQDGTPIELQKYHKWRLRVNAEVVRAEDFAVALEFAQAIKPAWTDLDAVATLYLVDEVFVTDDIAVNQGIRLYDDVALSLEATAMQDDWNGGSLLLHHWGIGAFSSRLMFDGYDLVVTAGLDRVTSARGGFLDPAPTQAANTAFPGPFEVFADDPMIRPGDLIYLHEVGPNQGWYYVSNVIDDNTLQIEDVTAQLPDLSGPPLTALVSAQDVRFVIARWVMNPLARGTGLTGNAAASTLQLDGAALYADGVTVDDEVIVMPGEGRYIIREVVRPTPATDPWETVRVHPAPPDGVIPREWMVVRRYLDPLYIGADMFCFAGDNVCFSNIVMTGGTADRFTRWDLAVAPLRARLTILSGANKGEYDVIDSLGPYLVVHPPFVAHSGPEEFTLDLNHPWEPWAFDKNVLVSPESTLRMAIYRPRAVVVAVGDLEVLVDGGSQLHSTAGLPGAAVGDFVEVGFPTGPVVNAGVYEVTAVLGPNDIQVGPSLALMVPNNARILRDAAVFDINNEVVTVGAVVDLQALGVVPGDIFEVFNTGGPLPAQVTVVQEVISPTVFTTTRVLFWGPIPAPVTGRILREEIG